MPESIDHSAGPLIASQRDCAIVNLRGAPDDAAFANGVNATLGLSLPAVNEFSQAGPNRLVWVGPDDWFSIGMTDTEAPTCSALRAALNEQHAVTDVTGGYCLITLSGPQARDILASGCPLDLHPTVFQPGMAASSHFYKAAIRLWMVDEEPRFELLVRRSFVRYFWQLLDAACAECGVERQDLA
jgi:sarcosine oxidase subunit gamma